MDLKELIRTASQEQGFHAIGVAAASPLHDHGAHLERWIARRLHGGLGYMERWRDVRVDPSHRGMVEGARSVVSLAMSYGSSAAGDSSLASHIAMYARGPDYHGVLRERLGHLLDLVRREAPGVAGRAVVDTAPLLERAWAARAGLGWIGRNTCLLNRELGSLFVLGELVLSVELEPDDPCEADGCGECRACVEACPTSALAAPDGHVLDVRRCLSYWTIEAKADLPPDVDGTDSFFGCDACQLSCPYNASLPPRSTPLAPLDRWREVSLEQVAQMADSSLKRLIEGTALGRAGAGKLRAAARRVIRGQSRHRDR